MKCVFLVLEGRPPEWVSEARQEYVEKLKPFISFEVKSLKSPSAERDQADIKRRKEAELILKQVDAKDYLVLFDEAGQLTKSSELFAEQLRRPLESGKARVLFCIGGPYGFDSTVIDRAQAKWSLSPLTMNHWLAQLVALEQVYRAFTLLKNIPYHNR